MPRFNSKQRAAILEAAIDVFAAHGLEGTTIRMVGDAAGYNSALLYYYFEDKRTLFVEALRLAIRGILEGLAERRRVFGTGRERLALFVDTLFDYLGAQPARLRLVAICINLHPELVAEVIQDFTKEGMPVPLEVLQEGIDKGQLKDMHPIQIWWGILGMCLFNLQIAGVAKHLSPALLPIRLPEPSQSRQSILEVLCSGLLNEPSSLKRKSK